MEGNELAQHIESIAATLLVGPPVAATVAGIVMMVVLSVAGVWARNYK